MQPSSKGAAAAPKVDNSEVELGSLQGDAAAGQNDIMHLARIGDVAAMEKLFEAGEFDATFSDDEGITPLHVRLPFLSLTVSPAPELISDRRSGPP